MFHTFQAASVQAKSSIYSLYDGVVQCKHMCNMYMYVVLLSRHVIIVLTFNSSLSCHRNVLSMSSSSGIDLYLYIQDCRRATQNNGN